MLICNEMRAFAEALKVCLPMDLWSHSLMLFGSPAIMFDDRRRSEIDTEQRLKVHAPTRFESVTFVQGRVVALVHALRIAVLVVERVRT